MQTVPERIPHNKFCTFSQFPSLTLRLVPSIVYKSIINPHFLLTISPPLFPCFPLFLKPSPQTPKSKFQTQLPHYPPQKPKHTNYPTKVHSLYFFLMKNHLDSPLSIKTYRQLTQPAKPDNE